MTTEIAINNVPNESYGIVFKNAFNCELDAVVEQVRNLGYAILDSGYSIAELQNISSEFDCLRAKYIEMHTEKKLRSINEFHTMRSPLSYGSAEFVKLIFNNNLLFVLRRLIQGKFILNQQNGIVNPPKEKYNQGIWHRDLPYQHFVSSKPLAINALFCVDDFTIENGATFVLPASHLTEAFPSESYIRRNAI